MGNGTLHIFNLLYILTNMLQTIATLLVLHTLHQRIRNTFTVFNIEQYNPKCCDC